MTADDIMTREFAIVSPDATLSQVRNRFREAGRRHLLVVGDEGLVGAISDRDMLRALRSFLNGHAEEHRDGRTPTQAARELMREGPTIVPGTDIGDAASVLLDRNVPSLPVLENGDPVGLLTIEDLLRYYMDGE